MMMIVMILRLSLFYDRSYCVLCVDLSRWMDGCLLMKQKSAAAASQVEEQQSARFNGQNSANDTRELLRGFEVSDHHHHES